MMTADSLTTDDTVDALTRLGIRPGISKVLIVGLGKTGLSVARFLSARGFPFAVADSRAQPPMLAELQDCLPDAPVFLGGFDAPAFEVATHLIVSPGVSLEIPAIRRALEQGAVLISDIDLFASMVNAPVVAVTGSNGKSTVTTLVARMAEVAGIPVRAGGNLGTPALDLLDPDARLYVLELSSFQLERSSLLHPAAATVLNVSSDHMDRYVGLEEYSAEKQRIFSGDGVMVLNADDPRVAAMAEPGRRCFRFGLQPGHKVDYGVEVVDGTEWLTASGTRLMQTDEMLIKGRHNVANALAALALGDAVGLSREAMCRALRRFPGLEHRMQWVAEADGIVWYNDSKATNIGACAAALGGIAGKVVLLAGGDGKGADFGELVPAVTSKARAVILMGKDADLIDRALAGRVPTRHAATMEQAVEMASKLAQPGDTVLLAPACSSLDQYSDYQERGRVFVEAVRRITT